MCTGLETEQELSLIPADRRRLTVATLITVAALPALWLMQRDPSTPSTAGVAVAGPNGGIAIAGSGNDDAATSTSTTVAATEAPTTSGPSVAIVTPSQDAAVTTTTLSPDRRRTGTATYKRYEGYGIPNPCMAPGAPVNTTITIRSLNTGRTIQCRNVVGYTPLAEADIVVVINTETFLDMADTRDAPVAVEITW